MLVEIFFYIEQSAISYQPSAVSYPQTPTCPVSIAGKWAFGVYRAISWVNSEELRVKS